VRREWEPEDLVASWTLVEQNERELVAYKRGPTRLGFALMLKFLELEARFPRHANELPPAAIAYVARQVDVDPAELAEYEWTGSTAEYHRFQIRRALGFRRFSEDDEATGDNDRLTALNTSDGSQLWDTPLTPGDIAPTVANGVVYTSVRTSDYDGCLEAYNATTGAALASYPLDGNGTAPALIANGTIYVGDQGVFAFTSP
jgi:hypothetical protein